MPDTNPIWKPMNTAPQDGTEILGSIRVHNGIGDYLWECHVIKYDPVMDGISDETHFGWSWDDYSHWTEIPEPPED